MERLIQSTFIQLVSGRAKNGDLYSTYRDFTFQIFEMCNDAYMDYGCLIFALNNATIKLTSLQERVASNEAKKKCGNVYLHPEGDTVH